MPWQSFTLGPHGVAVSTMHACRTRDLQEGLGVRSLNKKFKKAAGSLIKGFTPKSSVLGMFKLNHPVARKV